MPVEAVTFDFWNTLASAPPRTMSEARRSAVTAACRACEVEVEPASLDRALATIARSREESWAAGRHFPPADGARELARSLRLEGDSGQLVAEAFLNAGREAELVAAPGIGATLEQLRARGLALGIVCDAGFTGGEILRELLDRTGLLAHFSAWGFSDEVGSYKPAPEIFLTTLERLGAPPAAALHVGDLRRTDVAGARAVGMRTVRYRGVVDDPNPGAEADFVIADHGELPGLLARLSQR